MTIHKEGKRGESSRQKKTANVESNQNEHDKSFSSATACQERQKRARKKAYNFRSTTTIGEMGCLMTPFSRSFE